MLFKLSYLPTSLNMMHFSIISDFAVRKSAKSDIIIGSYLRHLFSVLKDQLVNNYHRAVKAQVDSLIP